MKIELSIMNDDDEDTPITINDVISTLKQLMETSTLIQYKERLNIILAHHCHLTYMEQSEKQGHSSCP